jgi:hypothetical protein
VGEGDWGQATGDQALEGLSERLGIEDEAEMAAKERAYSTILLQKELADDKAFHLEAK